MVLYNFSKSVVICALFLILGCLAMADEPPATECALLSSSPVIDGKGDDACWTHASLIESLNDNTYGRPAQLKTTVRLFSDGDNLYVFSTMEDPNADKLDRTKLQRDKLKWFETFEVFLAPDPDRPAYNQIAVDPAGTLFDNIGLSQANDHDFAIQYATIITETGWQAELAIPLKEVGFDKKLEEGNVMNVNFCRMTRDPSGSQVWAVTGDSFHVREKFGTMIAGSSKKAAIKMLQSFLSEIKNSRDIKEETGRKIATLKKIPEKINTPADFQRFSGLVDQVRLEVVTSQFPRGKFAFWRCNPWSLPGSRAFPKPKDTDNKFEINSFQNEYVTMALGMANPSDEPVRLRCIASEAKHKESGKTINTYSFLKLRRVVEIALRSGGTQRDALPPLEVESVFDIMPATNEVLWFTFNTNGLAPGTYEFKITAIPTIKRHYRSEATITLTVQDCALSKKHMPNTHAWARWTWPPVRDIRMACYQDLDDHYITFIMSERDGSDNGVSSIKYDNEGNIVSGPVFSGLQKKIDFYGPEKTYLFGINMYGLSDMFYGGKQEKKDILSGKTDVLENEILKKNFKLYLDTLYSTLEKNGIKNKDNFLIYLWDEPSPQYAKIGAMMGKLLFTLRPDKAATFVTFYSKTESETVKTLLPYVTHWCPALNVREDQLDLIRDGGRKDAAFFMGYGVYSRVHSVYHAYRRSCFLAMKRGFGGAGFWNYCDAGDTDTSTTWDDFESSRKTSDYAVIYEGTNGPVPSVRWEAWRQGVQDWLYVRMLEEIASKNSNKKLQNMGVALAKEAVTKTMSVPNTTTADAYVEKMRSAIMRLRSR